MWPLLALIVVVFLLKADNANAEWMTPYFKETGDTNGVSFQSAVGVQKINVLEELPWPFKLVKINYEGGGTPTLGAFEIGDNNLLGGKITFNDMDGWLITIEKRQDYENPNQRIYSFQVYIKDDELGAVNEQGILLTLQNVFDNSPSVTYNPSPCRIEELHANFLTDCIFTVYDPDGMDRNNIRLEVGGQFAASNLFEFENFGMVTTYERTFKLRIKDELHYEERAMYNLEVRVYDANNNTGDIFAILEVIDLPNRDPIWVRPLTTATFDEKQEQFFSLKAIDGDTGIDKPICYRLEFEEDYSHLMDIDINSGLLHVAPIDRDALNQQIFTFYTCAYKCDNSSWAIKNTTILVVQDINDHSPQFIVNPRTVQILEAKFSTLPLEVFYVEDMDLGNNGTYDIFFAKELGGVDYSKAFALVPDTGYQRTNFSLTVINAELLDFEDENWRSFQISVVAQELADRTHSSTWSLSVDLINWNDERPIFSQESYEINILENVTSGTFLQKVMAIDRDIDDSVVHSIVGNVPGIQINEDNGDISTIENNVFDYERQQMVLLQIQAKDTLITNDSDVLHMSYAQLKINIIDINDEMPELRLPRSIINITENSNPFTLLTNKIEARDPDSTANLTFEINWNSSYASKSGQEAVVEDYKECLLIQPRIINRNLVYGLLRVNPSFPLKIDYEKFDTIFLTIVAKDLNQEINEDTSTAVLSIRVDDVNDNPPEFKANTLTEPRRVTEMEEKMSIIGTIEAFDIDGPGNNVINFSLRSFGNLTKDNLVSINPSTGVLRINDNIQCDVPKIYNLEYEVILTDGVHETIEKINISITDINNQAPELDSFEHQVFLFENATNGEIVGKILAHDDDRDYPHNSLEFSVNNAIGSTQNLFQINVTTGVVSVYLKNGLFLDRDNGVSFHYIPIDIKDNFDLNSAAYGPVNQRATFLNVTLLDVNDNAPEMPARSAFSVEFSEDELQNATSKAQLIAVDIDEPNTPNSWVAYRVLSITPSRNNSEGVSNYSNLFDIKGDDRVFGVLYALRDLKGFYGYWEIEIEAFDHGEPVQRSNATYEIFVRPINFHSPVIVFPESEKSIRLCYLLQEPHRPLFLADCVSRLPFLQAYDPDGGDYGDVNFQLSSDIGDDKYFEVVKETHNQSSLYLKETLKAGVYYLNLRATDGGGSSSKELRNLRIVFVDMLGNPIFLESTFSTNFTENELGLSEERYIPAAYDPKNEGLNDDEEQLYKLYYFIDDSVFTDQARLFELDKVSRLLRLKEQLDRETQDSYHFRVIVTNSETEIKTNPNSINYTLEVAVKVNDVNDNAPKFSQSLYAAGVTPKDSIGKEILILQAFDPDLDDPTTYEIDGKSFENNGVNTAVDWTKFFILNRESGALSLGEYVNNNMKGFFKFEVVAMDTADVPHVDTAVVQIYIVSEANRVKFVFLSDVPAIRRNDKEIKQVFQEIYGYEICNIDSIDDVTNEGSKSREDAPIATATSGAFITNMIVHFINRNEAVEASEIQRRSTDLAFVSKLQNALQHYNLILNDVPHLDVTELTHIVNDWLLITLVVVSTVLGALSMTLIVVFIWKMRQMKRQLKAFEPTQFGSISSQLNRIDAPTTNIFSVEGSNPVIKNKEEQFAKEGYYEGPSSSDSDSDDEDEFSGIHNDPTFEMNDMKNYDQQKSQAIFDHKILNNDFFEKGLSSQDDKIRF